MTMKNVAWSLGLGALVLALVLGSLDVLAQTKTARSLTKKELAELVEHPKSAEDHTKLSRYFSAEADLFEADAKYHQTLAEAYRRAPTKEYEVDDGVTSVHYSDEQAKHCEKLAKNLTEAADATRALATRHEEMAEHATKSK